MDFLKAGIPRNRRGGMLVEGTPVTAELKLLPDADFLVAEDCGRAGLTRPSAICHNSIKRGATSTYKRLPAQQRAEP